MSGMTSKLGAALALLLVIAPGAVRADDAPADDSTVLAKVNGTPITLGEIKRSRAMLPPDVRDNPLTVTFKFLLEDAIDRKLLAAEARTKGVAEDEEVRQRLAEIEERVLGNEYLRKEFVAGATDKALLARYETFLKDNPETTEVRARHILVETREQALDVIQRLDDGEDFALLAAKVSIGPSGKNGGELGYFTKNRMVPEFANAAFALQPGGISREPVRTQYGWHVIKVEDRRVRVAPSFDEMEEQIREMVNVDIARGVVKRLREDAEIERIVDELPPSAR